MAFSPDSKARRRPSVARAVLAALILLNAGAFVGTRLRAGGGATDGGTARRVALPRRAGGRAPPAVAARRALAHAEPEVWASGGASPSRRDVGANVTSLLTPAERDDLRALCGRTLYHSLQTAVRPRGDGSGLVFVATGDIDDMWIRDSAVQLSIYFPRMAAKPALRRVLEGAIKTQAFYIAQDPYANSYSSHWRDAAKLPKSDRIIGRGGWVATRNYELDSGAYYLNMLWNYLATPDVFGGERFLNDTALFDAAMLLVDTWTTEQRHEEASPYRYSELPRGGKGAPSGFTGMSWSGYRPSDDPQVYGYNVPVNMYAAGALERALEVNARVWRSPRFAAAAAKLAGEIRAGIDAHGVITHDDGTQSYAYEVDGLGGALTDFDDPNVPSLLAIPLLGYAHYDDAIYKNTRARILSSRNEWYFSGSVLSGLGSPHTPRGFVWPLAVMVGALTTDDAAAKADAFRMLLRSQCGNGLMHESVAVDNGAACTRDWFEWANAMYVTLYEDTFRERCDGAADAHRLATVGKREGAAADPLHYETLEAQVQFLAA